MAQDTNQGYLLLIEGNYLIRNSSILKFYFLKFKNLHMHSQRENLLKKKAFCGLLEYWLYVAHLTNEVSAS